MLSRIGMGIMAMTPVPINAASHAPM